ncbi:MAG: DUF1156 domain-containing protein [Methanobacteriaceae archaeon]|nr:DUF1156 domain-containing protein [Methanobacteriaceae archaeon]
MDKRFIEESFPVKEVSEISAKEKNIRHGHISTLHTWWARRPLASSRTTNYAALIPAPKDDIDWIKKRNFIIELGKWDNSLNENLLKKAQEDIINYNNGKAPKVLDPFSGGGAIPLEALRLGCETYANDYNPVAVLIEKCTLEYPQRYGQKLKKDVQKWSKWVFNEVKKDLGDIYPDLKINAEGYFGNEINENITVGYLWARTVICNNPLCESEIPLLKHFWLVRKSNKKISLIPSVNKNQIKFDIIGDGYSDFPEDFDPSKGTISRSNITCPICGSVISAEETRSLFKKDKSNQRMIAVIFTKKGVKGKFYRIATKKDNDIYNTVNERLNTITKRIELELGYSPIPDEDIPPNMTGCIAPPNYGMNKWGDLFNTRQKLMLISFVEKIRQTHDLIGNIEDKNYAKAIITYLGFIFDGMLARNTALNIWDSTRETISNLFGRQAIPITWDYIECNPFSGSTGSWEGSEGWILRYIEHAATIKIPAEISSTSATELNFSDNFFDAVFTDPPYYNSVPYADLSDFFYVWLKRILGHIYPFLMTPLTPKSKEITEMAGWDKKRYSHKDKLFFEENLKRSFYEINRVLKVNGIATIVYAHKTTEGWETIINALLDSGLTVTASWPLSTEMANRLRAKNSAALASSIYIVARKLNKNEIGWFKEVKKEINEYIPFKLNKLWDEGISGADFFISAIGSAIEIFGKYQKVLDNEGNEIRADKLLSFVRDVVTDYAVRQILHNGIADELDQLTKFYLLWRWNYQEVRVPFDEARKLAQSAGIDLSNEWNKGFIVKKGEFITVNGPDKRDKKSLKNSKELIDVLHHVCLLWKEGKTDEMKSVLKESGYGESEALYKVAQAISETLPNSSSEKKLIEGFLAGKEKLMQDMKVDEPQTKLL